MCGIVGYVGAEDCVEILLGGLRRLEYRGYDSAGIAVLGEDGRMQLIRSQGKIKALEEKLQSEQLKGTVGIGHTRWATHGRPSDRNAHPHQSGPLAVVHNGIIENYAVLKKGLEQEGLQFSSETDTEVVVKLAEKAMRSGMDFSTSIVSALRDLRGSYALVFLCENNPGELIATCKESPLILGLSDDAVYVASDVPAILPYTRKVVFLADHEIAYISRSGVRIQTLDGEKRQLQPQWIDWNPVMAEKAGFKHFMLKEIYEQPRAVIDTFRGEIAFDQQEIVLADLKLRPEELAELEKLFLVACGTSYHACMVGKYMLEGLCRMPVEVDLGSEFRYRQPILKEKTLLMVISQSGETADTRAALMEGLDQGVPCRAIVNVVGSSLARMAKGVIYTHAGPEIGVASTKAFTTQLIALYLFTLYWAKALQLIPRSDLALAMQDLLELPRKMEEILSGNEQLMGWAKTYGKARDFLYLARGILYPIALEGALKLKEISYIHAEGYAAGEMKHGPIALIDENVPVVVLIQRGPTFEKMLSNVEEVKSRGGRILAVIEESPDERIGPEECQFVVPKTNQWLAPVLFVLPLQILAYHVAVLRGTDVDQPRNLAKSVTVE
ncbi:MAG TPA: glutamine--fructose-6-phosphate transaminase (isomerizing) [Syntrophobacteraceae bacterium]|nr:glutamine--fructose-6-phosphate transaminase (isomerizing) [Syntrophobacteraceae bacterium]